MAESRKLAPIAACSALTAALLVATRIHAAAPAQIRFLDVDSASAGSFVGVYGKGFGQEKDKGSVTAGGVVVPDKDIAIWSDALVVFGVPSDAIAGPVVLTLKGGTSLQSPVDLGIHAGSIWVVSWDQGIDEHAGDRNNPFQTLRKALSVAHQGDTILVRSGLYDEPNLDGKTMPAVLVKGLESDASNAVLTLRGFGAEVPVVRGTSQNTRDNPVVYVSGDNVRLARIQIDAAGNNSTALSLAGSGVWVVGLDIAGFSDQGVWVGDSSGTVLMGNHVHEGGTKPPYSHGVNMTGAGATIRGNELDHLSNGYGLVLQYQSQSTTLVEGNSIHDIGGGGIGLWRVKGGNRIVNNAVWNTGQGQGCGCGLQIAYGAQAGERSTLADRVYYNTFTGPSLTALEIEDRSGTIDLRANIFSNFAGAIDVRDPASTLSLSSAGNLWFGPGGPPMFRFGAGWVDFDSFRTASKQEADSILGDPGLVDPSRGDLHLTAASPVVDRGASGTDHPPREDFDGVTRPQGADTDWGAFELVPGDSGVADGAADGHPDAADGSDASLDPDAGADARPAQDVGAERDGTPEPPVRASATGDGGCGCRVPHANRPATGAWIALLIGGWMGLRMRGRTRK
jgi:hypothetical protein